MLEILLIRHGQTDWNRERRIMGRLPIPLNRVGRQESESLRKILRSVSLDVIYTSPLLRAVQTARVVGWRRKIRIVPVPAMAEIDYGKWVGKTFAEVSGEKSYRLYHTEPRRAQAPGGERMTAVYRRAVGFVEKLRRRHSEERVAVVSHADVINAILVHYLNLDLNDLLKIRIDNCSLSLLWFNGRRSRVLGVNGHADLRKLFLRTDQLVPPLPQKGIRRR